MRVDSLRTWWYGSGASLASRLSPHVFNRADNSRDEVFLTFDDGPSNGTGVILDCLNEQNIPATFFLTGSNISGREDVVERISRHHDIGNHFFTHEDPWRQPGQAMEKSIYETEETVRAITGRVPMLIRPPYGHVNRSLVSYCSEFKTKVVLWDVMPGDFRPDPDVASMISSICSRTRAGSIIVLHDIDRTHADTTLVPLLTSLSKCVHAKGFRFGNLESVLC